MNALPLTPRMISCSGGPGDGLAGVHLGFAAEPIVNLLDLDATVLYSECLARIKVAGSRLLTGADFVGGLEAQGAIGLLDAAIVGLVLNALAEDRHAQLGCNLSPQTLADGATWNGLLGLIAARPSLAARLTIEITESASLNEIPEAAPRLREARAIGCRLAIDDFGAGFATSASLQEFNFEWDVVKIDRSCFRNLRKTPSLRNGLRSLVGLAACFAPMVVIEGVETPHHLAAARDAGAHYGQGWLFGRPICKRWTVFETLLGARLSAAMVASGRISLPSADGSKDGDPVGRRAQDILRTHVNGLGDRVRAIIARAKTGGSA